MGTRRSKWITQELERGPLSMVVLILGYDMWSGRLLKNTLRILKWRTNKTATELMYVRGEWTWQRGGQCPRLVTALNQGAQELTLLQTVTTGGKYRPARTNT